MSIFVTVVSLLICFLTRGSTTILGWQWQDNFRRRSLDDGGRPTTIKGIEDKDEMTISPMFIEKILNLEVDAAVENINIAIEPTAEEPSTPLSIIERPTVAPDGSTFPVLSNPDRDFREDRDGGEGQYWECEGECDDDDECKSGLICYERRRRSHVPGCTGEGEYGDDYCIDPSHLAYLGLCEGSCTRDEECYGDLICYKTGLEFVPGCAGAGDSDVGYCVDPEKKTRMDEVAFRLRLYWKSGYDWQDSSREKWYCLECESGCSKGNDIELGHCDERGTKDSDENVPDLYFQFLNMQDESDDWKSQIQVFGTQYCLETGGSDSALTLQECDEEESSQYFEPGRSDDIGWDNDRFEIRNSRGRCLTQEHHPKKNEDIYAGSCSTARGDDTSYWEKW